MKSLVDWTYCKYANRNPFFPEGWGDAELLRHLIRRDVKVLENRKVGNIRVDLGAAREPGRGVQMYHGSFESPYQYKWKKKEYLPDFARTARFELLEAREPRGLVIHFAATGDEGYARRRMVARPLLKHGISSLILENPYYGSRRSPDQDQAVLPTVLSLMRMSRAAQDEGIALARYFRKRGYKDIMMSGISMGGYVAAAAGREIEFPVKICSLVPSHSAAPVYTEGALMTACDWRILTETNPMPEIHPLILMRKLFFISDMDRHRPRRKRFQAAIIGARKDAYIPEYSVDIVHRALPGSSLEWIRTGHVGAFILGMGLYRRRILDLFGIQS
ncbi:MAG: alpha/beta hydrolase family protein [Leptospiraceae bacterium]|nr:alpha/beta hydrolase family protein [Leptospiraceae bacterium]